MGSRWPVACLVLAVLVADVRPEEERWSRPATAERRQGDWVPLTCANCRPLHDQGVQASNSLPSVLTPPPRAEEGRLLPPPPPPPDSLFQTAASGFLQAFTQPQPPRKHHQFLQETSAQSINRPQAQFLKSNGPLTGPKPPQQFFREPSQEFQPPQEPQRNRQPQLLQYNQQFVQDQPYLNQPLFFGPQFLPAPFFPQTSIPPQNIQSVSPVQIQQQNPISPNVLPVDSQNFQLPPDRPVFTQQITTGAQELPGVQQQAVVQPQTTQQQSYPGNETESQRNEDGKEEVQLLYVPVETLNQRARAKSKSLPSAQQGNPVQQITGVEGNTFSEQSFDSSTQNSLIQSSFNIQTQTSKPQYNSKQNYQFQQQLPPIDQDKFNTQTHSIRQQFVKQNDQLQQQPVFGGNLKLDAQNTKQQYNFKTNNFLPQSQLQSDLSSFNSQVNFQQNAQLQPQNVFGGPGSVLPQTQNTAQQFDVINQPQQDQVIFNGQTTVNNQFRAQPEQVGNNFQQQLPPVEQPPSFNSQDFTGTQQFNQNLQFQQSVPNFKDQAFLNQPFRDEQPLQQQEKFQQQTLFQQPQPQEHFINTEQQQQTNPPVAQTVTPQTTLAQENNEQRFINFQQDLRHLHQERNNQFTRKFPQDYQQSTLTSSSTTRTVEAPTQLKNEQRDLNQQQNNDVQSSSQFQARQQRPSTLAPVSSTLRPSQTTLAPNQPPLSVYMETTEESKVNDVLRLLKNAKSIQVLDTVGPESPQVFVGPSNLKAPAGYIKFELPYLNSLDSNRVERKVDKLPFFVAPLNFNPPPGYSKIPFPAPHVGSVVVSNVTVLRTALHDKPYNFEPVPISSTEQYTNQYTLPEAISPISPQLPSLINSLRDEIYSASTTTLPSTTTESTTVAYTTPTYRTRGSNRGSHRGSSSYTTSPTTTRRVQPRTRRPYSRRQPITTTTTTEEPTTEASSQHSFTSIPEQIAFNSETYSVKNTITPASVNFENNQYQSNLQQENENTYYNEQFVTNNNFNQNRFSQELQGPSHPIENLNFQHTTETGSPESNKQFNYNGFQGQNEATTEQVAQTSSIPVQNYNLQQDDKFTNQRPQIRRDPSRHHQRFRNRQRLTTTTEIYEQPPQPEGNQFYTQTNSYENQNNVPSHNQRLVENTHFTASVPRDQFNIQTERADNGFQTTERQLFAQNENQNNQEPVSREQQSNQFNTGNRFEQTVFEQNSGSNQAALLQPQQNSFSQNQDHVEHSFYAQQQLHQGQFSQNPEQSEHTENLKINQETNFNQYQQTQPQNNQFQSLNSRDQIKQYDDLSNARAVSGRNEQDSNQQRHEEGQAQNDHLHHQQHLFQGSVEQTGQTYQDSIKSNPGQFEQVSAVTGSTPQDVHIQTTETLSSQSNIPEEPQSHQYNQQRLKYNRPASRTPITTDKTSEEFRKGHQYSQANTDSTDATNLDDVTTRASLVRVRGRVRSRQRGSVRQTTTTEEPNYPSSYLHRQKLNHESEEGRDHSTRKRVNYGSRPNFASQRTSNRDATTEQINLESYASTETQPSSEGLVDYTEQTTTTTEASEKGPTRKYQHILNRNKLRRVRPTNAPSTAGSSGTTRFLHPTTQPPVTRLPSSTRGRIRKPVSTKHISSTTEYSQVKPGWNEGENFAPSAGSNEILEPLYQTKDKAESSYGFQRNTHLKTSPKPAVISDDGDEFWKQAVTIQQSTSFDFKPEAVTPPSFKDNDEIQGTLAPIWNGQVELQDGNYYDAFNQRHVTRNDQTPFSSDQQKIVYKEVKSRGQVGKENQYTEKDYEEKKEAVINEEENDSKVYPVYREIERPDEAVEQEPSSMFRDQYNNEKKIYNKKDNEESGGQLTKVTDEETIKSDAEMEVKEGAVKRKIIATHPGKKGGRRRGSWVRVRVRKPQGQDVFETAESQNLGRFSENSIQGVTKTTSEKAPWTPEPVTEAIQTTTSDVSEVSEKAQTITFEQALKDMLKEFITNPEEREEGQEETETEASTDWPSQVHFNATEGTNEEEPKETLVSENNEAKSKSTSDRSTIKEDKVSEITILPEITTEVFTQEPTTVVPTIEGDNAEITVEPEVTTQTSEEFKQPQSRVLGTSTTTEISLETEICYRGRCVKTKKVDSDSDLLTME